MSCRWIPARELSIAWGDNPSYWKWTRHASCRSEVAELLNVCWLDITGRVDRKELRVGTRYSAFLVFKLRDRAKCLEKAFVSLKSLNNEITTKKLVFLDVNQEHNNNNNNNNDGPLILPHRRSDGWSEVKLGEFFNGSGDDGHVDMMLFERDDGKWKSGLIVRGIDVRPNNNSDVLNAQNINWFDCPDIDDGDAVLHKINSYNYDVASTSSGQTTDHVTIRMCLVLLFCLGFFLLCLVKSHTSILVLFSLMFFFLSVAFFG